MIMPSTVNGWICEAFRGSFKKELPLSDNVTLCFSAKTFEGYLKGAIFLRLRQKEKTYLIRDDRLTFECSKNIGIGREQLNSICIRLRMLELSGPHYRVIETNE